MTLKKLAAELGVHASTVSRALNPSTRHLVSSEVADQILKAVAASNFRKNGVASALRTRRSNVIGVVVPDVSNPVFPAILRGIETELRAHGYVAVLVDGGEDRAQQMQIVDQLLARQVDALILATTTRNDALIDHCLRRDAIVVAINRSEDVGRVSSVLNDEMFGMRLAFDHLRELGHTAIAHIVGPQHLSTGYGRKKGYVDAARAASLEVAKLATEESSAYTREAGRIACTKLLERRPEVTAILAGNDLIAIGCYDALADLKLKCPKDISVVGYNDMPFADLVSPPLTTVRIQHHQMGMQAAQLVLQRVENRVAPLQSLQLKPELIVRASTRAPMSRK